jgi:Zn-dependent protease with chaperone function
MRATLFIALAYIVLCLLAWTTLSGPILGIAIVVLLTLLVITMGYADTVILFLLGAREVRSSDEKNFFEAASQEAYKLCIPMPRLYFYNGSLERAFVLQSRNSSSIILNKSLLEKTSIDELKAICFELLIQIKSEMASKRTKSMFILGSMAWFIHSSLGLIIHFLPFQDFRKAMTWFANYLLHPVLGLLFQLIMGENYFKKLEFLLKEYPEELALLDKVGLKLAKASSYHSLPSRKITELYSINKSRHFQKMIALEFLPHEWDYLFGLSGDQGAK